MKHRQSALRWLAPLSVLAAILLIVLGSVVRVTGSGLGCPDWPLCHGGVVPPLSLAAIIEFSHRVGALLVTALVGAVTYVGWRFHHTERWVFLPALLAPVILLVQILLGAVTVWLELPPIVVGTHLGVALLLVADLVAVTLAVHPGWVAPQGWAKTARLSSRAIAALTSLFVLLILGATVVGTDASLACPDFPLCYGQVFPTGLGLAPAIQMLHRLMALTTFVLVGLLFWEAISVREVWPAAYRIAGTALALLVLQGMVGMGMVLLRLPLELRALHVVLAATIWTLLSSLEIARLRWHHPLTVEEGAHA